MNPLPLTDADLNAYVDGALAPARAAEVEQVLAKDAAITARVAEMRQQNSALREALDPWLADPIPPALLSSDDAWLRATKDRRRCSCTKTLTSSDFHCRCPSSRLERAKSRFAMRSRTASASITGSTTLAPTRFPARSIARKC